MCGSTLCNWRMAVILSEAKVVFEHHALAQCAAVSKQTSKREAADMTAMLLSLQCHSSVICFSGASVVSPETAAAAQTLLHCHDNPVSTGHARRRSEAVANLEPYIDRMANQYNKSSKVHWNHLQPVGALHKSWVQGDWLTLLDRVDISSAAIAGLSTVSAEEHTPNMFERMASMQALDSSVSMRTQTQL